MTVYLRIKVRRLGSEDFVPAETHEQEEEPKRGDVIEKVCPDSRVRMILTRVTPSSTSQVYDVEGDELREDKFLLAYATPKEISVKCKQTDVPFTYAITGHLSEFPTNKEPLVRSNPECIQRARSAAMEFHRIACIARGD